jgi:hypothetical protein
MSDAFQFGLKAAEIMFPGAQPPSRGIDFSALSTPSTLPQPTGPLTDDFSPGAFSSALAKSMDTDPLTGAGPMRLTDTDIASARAQAASEQRNFYNPLQATGRDHILDWVANTKPVQAASDFGRDFMHYGYNNPVWRAGRGIGRFADAAFDGKNSDRPLRAGWRAMMGPRDPNSFIARTGDAINNAYGVAADLKKLTSQAADSSKTVSLSPEEAAAASSAPKPTMGSYLSDSFKSNPMWLLPAAGLGGLGMYGLYKMMNARREAKKKRLMRPAAFIN